MEALTKLDGWWVGVHLGRPPMNCLGQIVIVDCHVMPSCSCVRFYLWYFAVLVGVAHCDDDVGCCCWLLMKRRTKIVDGKSRPAVRRWLTGRLAIKGTARICASRYLLRIMCASRYLFLVSHDIWKASSKKVSARNRSMDWRATWTTGVSRWSTLADRTYHIFPREFLRPAPVVGQTSTRRKVTATE